MIPIIFFLTSILLPIATTKYMNSVRGGKFWIWHLIAGLYCVLAFTEMVTYFVAPYLLHVSKALFISLAELGIMFNVIVGMWLLLQSEKKSKNIINVELDSLQNELDSLQKKNQSLEDKLTHRKSQSKEIEQYKNQIAELKRHIQSLQDRLALALKGVNPDLQRELEASTTELSTYKQRNQSLKAHNQQVQRAVDSKNQEIVQLKSIITELEQKNRRLNELCLTLAEKMSNSPEQIEIYKTEIIRAIKK